MTRKKDETDSWGTCHSFQRLTVRETEKKEANRCACRLVQLTVTVLSLIMGTASSLTFINLTVSFKGTVRPDWSGLCKSVCGGYISKT